MKNIYQNLEKSTHPMLKLRIENEADEIVRIIAAIVSLKLGEFQSAGELVIEGIVPQIYIVVDLILMCLKGNVNRF